MLREKQLARTMQKTKSKYKFAAIATDVIIFTVQGNELRILLIKMKKRPFTNYWAAPGGLVKPEESVDEAARRQLFTKTGITNAYLEQLYTFGEIKRDPFGRVVSVAYLALIPEGSKLKLKTIKEYADIAWFSVKKLPRLAYDHKKIIQRAISRLRSKLEYSNVIYGLLPREFTLSRLQQIYEIIIGRKLDKRNFRKKILALHLIIKVSRKITRGAHRPASLYQFRERKYRQVEIL